MKQRCVVARCREQGAGRSALSKFLLVGMLMLQGGIVGAQAPFSDADIHQETQRILNDAEFRYFDHLDESGKRPPFRSAKKRLMMTSQGDAGKTVEGNEGGEDGKSGRGKQDGQDAHSDRRSGKSQTKPQSNDRQRPADADDNASTSLPLGAAGSIGSVFGAIFHGLAYLVLIAVCGLIVYLIVLAIMSREAGPSSIAASDLRLDLTDEVEHSPGELPADAYLAQARQLADQRQYREAIAYLLLGGMSAIERADLIRHRRGLTLRDYLRVLRGRAPQFDGFQSMIGLYEPVGFGRRVASYQTFQEALAGYELAVTDLT